MKTHDGASAVYEQAIDRLVRFHPDVLTITDTLTSEYPQAPLGWALAAYLSLTSTDADDLAGAGAARDTLASLKLGDVDLGHLAAINAWLAGDWQGAARTLEAMTQRWPTDILPLMIGHQLDFFLGDATSLRDRPIRSLREFPANHQHVGFVRGMTAFGLEESGHYDEALDAALAAVEANADDVWAIHAAVHCYEMRGRVDVGVDFLGSGKARWKTDNFFTVHNWWHLALYQLELGNVDEALAIYDRSIHPAEATGVPIELLDATALLWRIWLDDRDTGGRFSSLSDARTRKVTSGPWYVFNDTHAAMAFAGAGRLADVRALIERHERWLESATGSNAYMTGEIGLPVCRSVLAWAEGRHQDVVEFLVPVRRTLQRFGGSHAQRDAWQRLLLESALRSGQFELARALSAERLGMRERSPYNWTQRARSLHGLGDGVAASEAEDRAKATGLWA